MCVCVFFFLLRLQNPVCFLCLKHSPVSTCHISSSLSHTRPAATVWNMWLSVIPAVTAFVVLADLTARPALRKLADCREPVCGLQRSTDSAGKALTCVFPLSRMGACCRDPQGSEQEELLHQTSLRNGTLAGFRSD